MHIVYRAEDFPVVRQPIILTIGNFDGVHAGHLHILKQMHSHSPHSHKCLITFTNHPSEILRPTSPTSTICTLSHKIALLRQAGIDTLLLLTFTRDFSGLSAEDFLQKIRKEIPFSRLILGHDATLGNKRQGTKEAILTVADRLGFEVHYSEGYRRNEIPVSSTLIRKHLTAGNLENVEELLGRPYSIYSTVRPGLGKGKTIGFPTANIPLHNLCLPPNGVYAVTIKHNDKAYRGIANLGVAPTIKSISSPVLETHIFSFTEDLYDKEVEVIFHRFIRPEKKFSSIEELKHQIQKDINLSR